MEPQQHLPAEPTQPARAEPIKPELVAVEATRRQRWFIIVAAVVVVVLLGTIGYIVLHKSKPAAQNQDVYIKIDAKGFMPQSVSVTPGTTVVWVDQDPAPHLPAANPYPSHSSLPSFVAPRALGKGQSYSYRFTSSGVVHYHDDLNPTIEGEVIVR